MALLIGDIALADDSSIFDSSLSSGSTLTAPILTVTTSGTKVSLSWTSVAGATGYILCFAPYPYTGPESIVNIPMGTQTSITATLSEGAAFYVAIQAYNGSQSSGYSNIEHFTIRSESYTNSIGMTFILLPTGTFMMGSPSDEPSRNKHNENQHQVILTQPFYMQLTEVTQAQWEAVMGSNPSYFSGCPTCPVEHVTWYDVQTFIRYMNARGEGTYNLPTEAQWEYAARAGSTTAFYNGGFTPDVSGYDPNLDVIGWYRYNSGYETHPVAQKTPNVWGLYDMSGNVWEWCRDWYSDSYYDLGTMIDPTGPSSGLYRVVRGGSLGEFPSCCRSAYRNGFIPDVENGGTGFRLMRQP